MMKTYPKVETDTGALWLQSLGCPDFGRPVTIIWLIGWHPIRCGSPPREGLALWCSPGLGGFLSREYNRRKTFAYSKINLLVGNLSSFFNIILLINIFPTYVDICVIVFMVLFIASEDGGISLSLTYIYIYRYIVLSLRRINFLSLMVN
jgi:hypothetical protein